MRTAAPLHRIPGSDEYRLRTRLSVLGAVERQCIKLIDVVPCGSSEEVHLCLNYAVLIASVIVAAGDTRAVDLAEASSHTDRPVVAAPEDEHVQGGEHFRDRSVLSTTTTNTNNACCTATVNLQTTQGHTSESL